MAGQKKPLGKVGYKNLKGNNETLEALRNEWPSRLEFTALERILTAIALLFLVATVIWAVVSYPSLPAEIPTHYDIHGQVDAYGSKSDMWILLLVDVLCVVGIAICGFFPRLYNVPIFFLQKRTIEEILRATRLYVCVANVGTAALFFYMVACIIMAWQLSMWIMMVLLALILLPMVPYFIYLSKSS